MAHEELEDLDPPEDEEVIRLLQSIDGRLGTMTILLDRMAQGLTILAAGDEGRSIGVTPLNLDALEGLGDEVQ